jgi:hypothetical protein
MDNLVIDLSKIKIKFHECLYDFLADHDREDLNKVIGTLSYNIVFRAKHIAGKSNIVADKLSRFHFQKARQVAPWLNLTPAEIPALKS